MKVNGDWPHEYLSHKPGDDEVWSLQTLTLHAFQVNCHIVSLKERAQIAAQMALKFRGLEKSKPDVRNVPAQAPSNTAVFSVPAAYARTHGVSFFWRAMALFNTCASGMSDVRQLEPFKRVISSKTAHFRFDGGVPRPRSQFMHCT